MDRAQALGHASARETIHGESRASGESEPGAGGWVVSHAASEWMPMHWADFWQSERVEAMTNDAALLYAWALWRQWTHGSLPADSASLKRAAPARFSVAFDALWIQVRPCFELDSDGRLQNERCRTELADAVKRSEKYANSGRKGGLAKAASRATAGLQPGSSKTPSRAVALIGSDLTEQNQTEHENQIPPSAGGKPRTRRSKKQDPVEAEPVPEGYAETVECYFECFQAAAGEKPSFRALEGRKIKELLAKAETPDGKGPERACAVIRYALSDHWRTSHGKVTLQGIVSEFNGLLVGARNAWKADLSKGQLAFVHGQVAEASGAPAADPLVYEKMIANSKQKALPK